jgi:hypothetical protein
MRLTTYFYIRMVIVCINIIFCIPLMNIVSIYWSILYILTTIMNAYMLYRDLLEFDNKNKNKIKIKVNRKNLQFVAPAA